MLYVQCGYYILRGELLLACQGATEHLQLGKAQNDPVIKSTACLNAASAWFYRGDFAAARAYSEQLLELYNSADDKAFAVISPQDPQPTGLIILSNALTSLGLLDQAQQRRDQALVKARERAHGLTLALVLSVAWDRDAAVRLEPALLLARAENLQAHCAEHVLPYFAAVGGVYRGLALSRLGQPDEGLAMVTKGLAAFRATGALLLVPKFLLLLSDCYRNVGDPKQGLKCLDEAEGLIQAMQIRSVEPDLYRRKGECLMAAGDLTSAATNFSQAIDIARRQQAKLFELQAGSALARLWRDQGKHAEARNLLGPIYNWFTEGFDAPDLRDAKMLLDELE